MDAGVTGVRYEQCQEILLVAKCDMAAVGRTFGVSEISITRENLAVFSQQSVRRWEASRASGIGELVASSRSIRRSRLAADTAARESLAQERMSMP